MDEKGVIAAREWVGADSLQRFIIDANDDDAGVGGAPAAGGEAKVEGALLDILQEEEAGALIAADSGIGEEGEAGGGDNDSDGGVSLLREPLGCDSERQSCPRE